MIGWRDPHAHPRRARGDDGGVVVRAYRPEAQSVRVQPAGVDAELEGPGRRSGRRCCRRRSCRSSTSSRSSTPDGNTYTLRDPYAFLPTLGELDLHLVDEGRHEELYERLGAHVREIDGVAGTAFAVWAPNARSVAVVGDFNSWDGRLHPMRSLGSSGIWELFIPGVGDGHEVQVRDPHAGRPAARQGRPARVRGRGAAGERVDRAAARRTSGPTPSGSSAPSAARRAARADVDLRGAPRLVAAQPARGQPLAHVPRARGRARATT